MKGFILFTIIQLFAAYSFGQNNSISMADDFKIMSGYSGNNTSYTVIPTYKDQSISGNPYFSVDWVSGSVTTTDNNVFSKNLLFMFDKYNSELYYKKADSSIIMKIDMNKISSFILNAPAPHLFMNSALFSSDYGGKYFEVLVLNDSGYSFLKLSSVIVQQPAYSEVAQVANNDRASKFVDKNEYFIYKAGQLSAVELKKKAFEKYSAEFASYITTHSGNLNELYAINLINYMNNPTLKSN